MMGVAELLRSIPRSPSRMTTEDRLRWAVEIVTAEPGIHLQALAMRVRVRATVLRAEIASGNMPGCADMAGTADYLERVASVRSLRTAGNRLETISRLLGLSLPFIERVLGTDAETPALMEAPALVPGECPGCDCSRDDDYSTDPFTSQLVRVTPCRRGTRAR